jgi:hypothetical protein
VIIFGWGRRTFHHAGPVLYQWCRNCSNSNWFYLVAVRRWLTLFFIPVIPYERRHMLICPVCNRGMNLSGAELQRAKSLNQLALQFTNNEINGDEYMRRLRESGGPTPAVAPGAAPPLAISAVPASDGFGSTVIAAQPPSVAPPMPSATPPFRGTPMSRRAQVVRVLVPVVLVALVAGYWIYSNQSNNQTQNASTNFQAGSCIDGSQTGTVITSVSCSGDHDARIDAVLAPTNLTCPPGDDELEGQPPDPNLCVDFNDHSP